MANESQLIQWKTNAWKNPSMVAWYDQRMKEQTGINSLKNHVETSLCALLAKPKKLLDIGIGTGRGSLPLARNGFEVTGIDSSKAMLDQCAKNAGDTQITLKIGDVTNLPFENAQFDTVMGLNVLIHFPHLELILSEWKRVAKTGGRIIFDVLSKDHFAASQNLTMDEANIRLNSVSTEQFNMSLSTNELVMLANKLDLRILDVKSIGAFTVGYSNYWLSDSLESKRWWIRYLSLMQDDDLLLEFVAFLEKDVLGILPPVAAPKIMVVFENKASEQHNESWAKRQMEFIEKARWCLDFEMLKNHYPSVDEKWKTKLNESLLLLRNRVFFYNILRETRNFLPFLDVESFLDERFKIQFREWENQDKVGDKIMDIARKWYENDPFFNDFSDSGVKIGKTLEYMIAQQLFSFSSRKQE